MRRIQTMGTLAVLACAAFSHPAVAAEGDAQPTRLETEKGYLLSGSGQWRTPNPDYVPGGQEPPEFGIDYRWGPHRQHIVGDIIGVGERGKAIYATFYLIYNPVTERVVVDLIGWDGTYGPAEERRIDERNVLLEALLYMPDGTIKANRHAYEFTDADTYILRTYEKDASGQWALQKKETWRQLPKSD